MKLTGAQALIRSLEMEGVEVIFGLPGGAILPVYDPIVESPIRHVLVRHEQGAGHAAEGYAHVTGRPGVAMVTSGPGVTNIVTALADAYMDSIPIVVISGQVATPSIGTDAFQEADTTGITMGVTKHNWLVTDAGEIPRAVAAAFHVATTGRPGPVLVDIPKDVSNASMEWYWPTSEADLDLPGYHPAIEGDPEAVEAAAALIEQAQRPVLYVGGGVLKARGMEELRRLVDLTGIPVTTTLMARSAFPSSHPLNMGMPGMHGTYTAVTAMQKSDLLIALGTRFDDRVTGKVPAFAPDALVIHIDIDPAELGKIRRPDIAIRGDCRVVTMEVREALERRNGGAGDAGGERAHRAGRGDGAAKSRNGGGGSGLPDLSPWIRTIETWRQEHPLHYEPQAPGERLKPQMVIETLAALTPDDTILVTGVGQHQMWASQFWQFEEPHTFVTSGGLGTMGFAVPAAIGAKVGKPGSMVWAVDGDGCFQMTAQELVTANAEGIPVKIAIINNSYLGMVRQWQELFYEERYSEVYLSPDLPDYVKWAEAMGCVGIRVTEPEEVAPAIEKANAIDDRAVVIDFRTDSFEKVYPMVPAGASNDDIMEMPTTSTRDAGRSSERKAS